MKFCYQGCNFSKFTSALKSDLKKSWGKKGNGIFFNLKQVSLNSDKTGQVIRVYNNRLHHVAPKNKCDTNTYQLEKSDIYLITNELLKN